MFLPSCQYSDFSNSMDLKNKNRFQTIAAKIKNVRTILVVKTLGSNPHINIGRVTRLYSSKEADTYILKKG